ncbi:MAG: pseudouridine-5'-phosphate glycosidase [Anaerolineae bacterium]|nr:pseudouridine-5'-phosphate glycosidase [Anaerolineae bacterium]
MPLPKLELLYSPEVGNALSDGAPIVALESTVITHGLPHPDNLQLALDMQKVVRANGATPATIAVLDGRLHVGLEAGQIETLAANKSARKLSRRDLAGAITMGGYGGTTVAATLFVAHRAGIRVFATGGIGGVHRQAPFDVSADLNAMADTPALVVSAGAKAILDLPATLEMLETLSVPVVGYQTDTFPAFYSRDSGLKVSQRVDSPEEAAVLASSHWGLGMVSAVLLAVPLPQEAAISYEDMESIINNAVTEAVDSGITGQEITPYLLSRVSQLSEGASLKANLALLKQNAAVAAQVAQKLTGE